MEPEQVPAGLPPFAAAKVSRPQMLRNLIRRRRLIDRLDAAAQCPVTLVCAGAGWGKTVLTSSWAGAWRAPVGWLTLDNQDNHPAVFWTDVVAALHAERMVPPGSPLADLRAVPDDGIERVAYLARGFDELRTPAILVLDDFHELHDAAVVQDLVRLIRSPPRTLRLILVTRSEPALELHRLRAAGQLVEIRAPELAFTAEEAAELLGRHGLSPPDDDIATLLRRTEGWPVGLQLAAAFLSGPGGERRIEDFRGDLRPVDAYLANEVLAEMPPELRRFMLLTSVCRHVSAGLAEAVTLEPDGQRALEELERRNDFVVRLGQKPEWYRYHRLLRDALRHRLSRESPALVPELHRRAARWNAAHHSVFEALDHAAAAEDWPYLAQLVVRHAAPLILSAHRSTLVELLQRVPRETLGESAELMACAALLLFQAGDYDAIPDHLDGARELSAGRTDADWLPVEMTLRALRIGVYRAIGDMPALVAEATQLLTRLAHVRLSELPMVMQYRAIALNNKGVGLLWTGRPDVAQRYLWAAGAAARSAGLELVEINAMGHLALLEVMHGSVREAAQLATGARELAERRGRLNALQSVAAHLALVLVCVERNEIVEAQRVLQQAVRAHRNEPEAVQWVVWLVTEARLALARGQPGRAQALLEQAQRQRDPRLRAAAVDRLLLLAECEADLLTGRPERIEARYRGAPSGDSPGSPERVCRARAAFALGDLGRAETLLAGTTTCMPEKVTTVQAGILTALIADARGHGIRAVDDLAAALALAEPEEIRRPFLALAGDRLERLLGRQNLLGDGRATFAADILTAVAAADRQSPAGPLAEALSEREAEVLHYLPTMLTASEIATELGVSVNTVKAHLRSIYRKLDAARRREAVIRAHRYGLL